MIDEKQQVMVVDDDEAIRKSLAKLLESEGYQVISAVNGMDAAENFRREGIRVDLLLIDLNMPVRNGWTAVGQLLEANPALPIFIITGLSHQHEFAEAAGARALVEKPIDAPGLLRLIRKQFNDPIDLSTFGRMAFHHLPALGNRTLNRLPGRNRGEYDHWGLNE